MAGRRFTKELLNEILQRDEATLVGEYEVINRDTLIKYSCKCGNEDSKIFRPIVKNGGALCKICCKIQRLDKCKKTWIAKYGVENPTQNKDIKEKSKKTNLEKYGVEYPSQNKEVQEKTKNTNLERYGVICTALVPEIKQKQKDTMILKYGVEHNFQAGVIRENMKNTFIEKYGVENPAQNKEVREKIKQTNLEKYGVENPLQSIEVKEKIKQTNLEKYGVEYNSQRQEVQERQQKNAKKYKEFTMPSGDIRKVQGYEPFALTELLKFYTEDQIKTGRKEIPYIQYEVDGKKKVHFPDIFIPHENKIIEVKSTWTYKCKEDNVLLKKKVCEEKGFVYEIWCYDKKGNRVEV